MVSYASTLETCNNDDSLADLTTIKYRWALEKVSKSKRQRAILMTLLTTATLFILFSALVIHH